MQSTKSCHYCKKPMNQTIENPGLLIGHGNQQLHFHKLCLPKWQKERRDTNGTN